MVVVGRDGEEVRRMDKIRRAAGLEGQSKMIMIMIGIKNDQDHE